MSTADSFSVFGQLPEVAGLRVLASAPEAPPDPVLDPPRLARQLQAACILAQAYTEEALSGHAGDSSLLHAGLHGLIDSERLFENELAMLGGSGLDLSLHWFKLAELEALLDRLSKALSALKAG